MVWFSTIPVMANAASGMALGPRAATAPPLNTFQSPASASKVWPAPDTLTYDRSTATTAMAQPAISRQADSPACEPGRIQRSAALAVRLYARIAPATTWFTCCKCAATPDLFEARQTMHLQVGSVTRDSSGNHFVEARHGIPMAMSPDHRSSERAYDP